MFPLAIRITKNRRSTFKHLGHYIAPEDWDEKNLSIKKSNPDADSLNNLLSSKLSELRKGLMNMQSENTDFSASQIKLNIYKPSSTITLYDYSLEHLENLEAEKKINRLTTDTELTTYIWAFHKSKSLRFQDINKRWLNKFKTYLIGKRELTETSALNVMVLIRLLFNRAINDKIVGKDIYPFGKGGFQIKFPQSIKVGLNKKEVQKLEDVQNLTEVQRHALNIWLYSFYLAGMRVSDVLFTRWNMIYDDRLHYRMGKNSKLLSLKIPHKALEIISIYQEHKKDSNDFIFPEMKKANFKNAKDVYNKIRVANSKFNIHLKVIAKKVGIQKKLTMHIARHTFGNIAGDTIHPIMLQKLYRHSDLKTTINYQANFIHKEADDALDSVINFSKQNSIYVLLLFVFIISCKGENSKSHLHSNHSSRGWSYAGETAPKFWAQLVEDSDCGGKHQSPINIISKNAKKQTTSKLKKYYSASTILTKVINNGHSIEFDFKQGDSIVIGETNTFHLSQIHFHEPAEHKINGIIYPIEIHLVHKSKNNNYTVMSIFGMEGDESQLFEFLESFLPLKSGDSKSINTSVDLASIFPEDKSCFTYKGSLTTPPCTEEVQWIVFTEPIILSLNEVNVLKENMPLNNFREEQPINGREVYFFEDK